MAKLAASFVALTLVCSCAPASLPAADGATPTFRIIAQSGRYAGPNGLIEFSPENFYSEAEASGPEVVLQILPSGKKTAVATLPANDQVHSHLATGRNGRLYTDVQSVPSATQFASLSPAGGPIQTYEPQPYAAILAESLPSESFLGIAVSVGVPIIYSLALVSPQGNVHVLYPFPSGQSLLAALLGNNGLYYGVASNQDASGYAFAITAQGALTELYSFPGGSFNGTAGNPALVQTADGNFYGSLPSGGPNGQGVLYRLTPSGQYTPLYTYPAGIHGYPTVLLQASDGNFYGAASGTVNTPNGGSELFELTPSGAYTDLKDLSYLYDGACPCTLIQGSDGTIYGALARGGTTGGGSWFALDAGLPKPPPQPKRFEPASGAPGTEVLIWGNQLLSASVSFNGTPAESVTNSGPNYVIATVPAGATSGPITVTTPGGTATTTLSFTVE